MTNHNQIDEDQNSYRLDAVIGKSSAVEIVDLCYGTFVMSKSKQPAGFREEITLYACEKCSTPDRLVFHEELALEDHACAKMVVNIID